MKKEEYIARYGEEAYERKLERERGRYQAHKEEEKARSRKYYKEHNEQAKAYREEHKAEAVEYNKEYKEEHKEQAKAHNREYKEEHKEQVIANQQEQHRKGGKYYDRNLKNEHTGLRGDRNRIRMKHGIQYKPYKDIIAPDSQIHHEWVPRTSEYRGVALVEKDAHMHGFVDVIEILDGKITLLTEEEVRKGKKNE